MLDLKEFLEKSPYKFEMGQIIDISNLAFKNWQVYWTSFFSRYICEELIKDLNNLNDLSYLKSIPSGYSNFILSSKIPIFFVQSIKIIFFKSL